MEKNKLKNTNKDYLLIAMTRMIKLSWPNFLCHGEMAGGGGLAWSHKKNANHWHASHTSSQSIAPTCNIDISNL